MSRVRPETDEYERGPTAPETLGMSCPQCEATAAFHGNTVHIWPPLAHTLGKLARALADAGFTGIARSQTDLRIPNVTHAELAGQLAHILTEPERRDCRLVVTQGETVTAAHIPHVLSVEAYITAVKGAWLGDILAENRLNFAFQPILDGGRHVQGHEALVRAAHRDGAPISPGDLFEAAGTPALLATLDRQARLTAVSHMPDMPANTRLFINFLPSTIYDPVYCLQSTAKAVADRGLDPRSVVFEIVESDKAQDNEHIQNIVDYYRRNGYGVALDDFGTGYNNLNTLLNLRPDYIKVDKAIIGRLAHDATSRDMVRDLVRQAHARGTAVIAEGIETRTDFSVCIGLGVDLYQGFYFAKPSPHFTRDADVAGQA